MALEEGVEVAAKEGPTKLAKMGPHNPRSLGALETLITLRTGAVGHTGNGARVPTIAAIGLYAPGRTESSPDLYNSTDQYGLTSLYLHAPFESINNLLKAIQKCQKMPDCVDFLMSRDI